jgi:hypothetical protein
MEINWHYLLFFGTLSIIQLLEDAWCFKCHLYFHFQAKKDITWWAPQIELLSFTGHHRCSNLLRYVPGNRSSWRVVTGKWLLKNWKLPTRLKNPGPIHELKIVKRAMNSDWSDHRFIHSFGMCRIQRFLAFLRSFFLSSLLCTFSCHPSPPTILPSSHTPSCHLFLGLPLNLLVPKFTYTLFGILFSSILCTCPNQHNLFKIRPHYDTKVQNTCIYIFNTTYAVCGESCESSWVQVSL